MRYFVEVIDRYDGRKCYSEVKANSKELAKAHYLLDYPNAEIIKVIEVPEECLTFGELTRALEIPVPSCMPVYIDSDNSFVTSITRIMSEGEIE